MPTLTLDNDELHALRDLLTDVTANVAACSAPGQPM